MKHPVEEYLLNISRRQFFGKMAQGIGAMALGWDEATSRVVVEAHAVAEDGTEIPDIADDDADGTDTLRVWLTPSYARSFAARAQIVAGAGRPPCPFCTQPLDPAGHVCPRANGYRRRS